MAQKPNVIGQYESESEQEPAAAAEKLLEAAELFQCHVNCSHGDAVAADETALSQFYTHI